LQYVEEGGASCREYGGDGTCEYRDSEEREELRYG
jgi:hypothetical protein